MKTSILLLILATLLVGCGEKKLDVIGTWRLDAQETVDKAIELGQLPEDQKEKMVSRLKSKQDRYIITVSKDRITSEKFDATYSVEVSAPDETRLRFTVDEKPITLTFARHSDEYAVIKSSDTNDMDYLVWRKEPIASN